MRRHLLEKVPPAGEDDEVQPAGGDDDEVQPAGGEDDEVQPLLLLIRGQCSLSIDLSLSTSPCFAHVSFQSLSPSSSFFDTSLSASLACRHALSHTLSPRAHTTASLDASSRCLGERTLALAQPRSQSPGSKGRLKEKERKRERMREREQERAEVACEHSVLAFRAVRNLWQSTS